MLWEKAPFGKSSCQSYSFTLTFIICFVGCTRSFICIWGQGVIWLLVQWQKKCKLSLTCETYMKQNRSIVLIWKLVINNLKEEEMMQMC